MLIIRLIFSPFLLFFLTINILRLSSQEKAVSAIFVNEELNDVYDLNDYLDVCEDPSGDLSIMELLDPTVQVNYVKLNNNSPLNPQSTYCLKVRLVNGPQFNHIFNRWNLFIGKPDLATVYLFNQNGEVLQETVSGGWHPASLKEEEFGNKVQRVKVSFDASQPITFFIRYGKKDQHPLDIDVHLDKYDFYQSLDYLLDSRRDWLFLGFILTMIIFNLIVFWSTRYLAFLYHGLFILGIFIFTLDFFGVTDDLVFIKDRPYLVQLIDYIGLALMDICYFQFVRHYLNLGSLLPGWDKMFIRMIYLKILFFTVLTIFYYSTFNEPLADKITSIFMVSQYVFVLVFLIPLYRTGERKGLYLIGGTLLLFMAILMNAISIINERGIWTLMTEIGLSGEILFFSVGLGFRFRELRDEEEEGRRLKELDEYKSKLLTNITHEFRTPLTVIKGVSELSKDRIRDGDITRADKDFEIIEKNSNDLLNLVNQMLDLAKLESKDMHVNLVQKDMIEVIRQVVETLKPLALQNHISLKLETFEDQFLMDLDQAKIQTILTNLLSNAIKFTPEDGLVRVRFLRNKKEGQESAHITVEDTGYGIDTSDLPRIFDRFHQIESGPTKNISGTGIGLALVKELVNLMKGEIKVTSKLGEGTRFELTFPVTRTTLQGLTASVEEISDKTDKNNVLTESDLDNTNQPVLLIVEDNRDVVNYLVALLEDQYILELAYDGLDGKDKALKIIPDLIISDVMMPGMDGIQLCSELKQDEKTNHIPIILLRAKVAFEDKIKGLEHGADAYLTKPFKKEELFVRLKKLNELRLTLQHKYSQFALLDRPEALKNENTFIHKVNSIIEENLINEQFSVEDLAKSLYMSRMQLHRKLKALSTRSASNYIRNYRLYKAKPMLLDPSLAISQIAWDVGFQDPNYFSKSFYKEFGLTPSDFRKK